MSKQTKTTTSGKGNFAWGVAVALILILTLLVSAVYYFFHDNTAAQLEILYADRDELVTSLGSVLSEKESITLRYENALISLEEKETLIARQNSLIEEYQKKIEECDAKIKALMPNDYFSNNEKVYLDTFSGVHSITLGIGTNFLADVIKSWTAEMLEYANLYEDIILENVSDAEVISFFTSIQNGTNYIYNGITYAGVSSVTIANLTTRTPSFTDNDKTVIKSLLPIKNSDGTYTVKSVAYSLCQFYLPDEIYNYTTEEKYFIFFGKKFYINSFDIFISGVDGYSLLDARTKDNDKLILNLTFYRNIGVSTPFLKLVVYDEINSSSCGQLSFSISSYIPDDFFENVE